MLCFRPVTATVLYLTMTENSPSQADKLAGIRRYCSTRGWSAEMIFRPRFSPEAISEILRSRRLVGCVVDGVANHVDLPPRLFRDVPVSYIGYMRGRTGTRPNFHFDTAAIVTAALRELSAGKPSCYGVIGFPIHQRWARQRVGAFRAAVGAVGAKCLAFPFGAVSGRAAADVWGAFEARLVKWLASLPDRTALFAVSDEVAVLATRAARAAGRGIPRSLTLVSVDNFPALCEGANPPISSIQLDFERAGFLAAGALDGPSARRASGRAAVRSSALAPAAQPILVPPLLVVRRKSTSGRGRHEKFVLRAEEIIRREACDGLTAAALAARFPCSRSLFELRFREATGHSVLDEILHVRLEKAFALLSRTDTAIGAVPALCGFRSYWALDDLFRARFGMGMRAWRRRNFSC